MAEKVRWLKKGIAKQRSRRTSVGYRDRSHCGAIRLPGLLQSEDEPHELLGGVG